MQALTVPLTRYVHDFPAPEALHAFERALLELTVGEERYVTALDRVAAMRKPLSEVRPGNTNVLPFVRATLWRHRSRSQAASFRLRDQLLDHAGRCFLVVRRSPSGHGCLAFPLVLSRLFCLLISM